MRRMALGLKSRNEAGLGRNLSDASTSSSSPTGGPDVPEEVAPGTPTGTPGRQAHPLRKASLSGGSKKQSFPKEDQDLTSARSVSHAEALSGQTANLVGSATESEACFNMVNFILGAGVLGYPFCYKACGLVLTTLLILVCLVAAQLSMRLLLMSSQLSGKRTYEELARLCFGKPGQRVMGTCVFMLNLGALVAYVNILADVLSSVAGSIIPPGAEPSRNIIMTGITLFGALPVALLVKSPGVLALVSQVSVAFIFFFAAVVAVLSLSPTQHKGPLLYWRPAGALVAFPVVAYGFTTHHFIFVIYSSLKSPSVKRMTLVAQKAMFLCTLVYITVGVCGYTAFKDRTAGDVLRNFGARGVTGIRGAYERLIKVGYGLSILGTVPLVVLPFQDSLGPLLAAWMQPWSRSADKKEGVDDSMGKGTHLQEQFITTAVLGTALIAAVFLPNVEFIFGLAGSTASVLIAYILPAAIFLVVSRPPKQPTGTLISIGSPTLMSAQSAEVSSPREGGMQQLNPWGLKGPRRKAWTLLVFGMVVAVVCTRATLTAVQQEAEVVLLAQELVASEAAVVQAVRNEQKAKEVATAVDAVSEAARSIGSAQEDASALSGAALQAAAALSSLNGTAGNQTGFQAGQEEHGQKQDAGNRQDRDRKHAESKSFALGAVNHNLQAMKQRVNTTLVTFESVTAALEATTHQLRKEQAHAEQKQLERQQHLEEQHRLHLSTNWLDQANSSLASNATNGTDHVDDFISRIDKLRQHTKEARAGGAYLANGTSNFTEVPTAESQAAFEIAASLVVDADRPDAAAKDAQSASILTAVYHQANATLAALRQTAAALDAVERAAAAVEQAKGRNDDTGQAAAGQALEEAMAATREAAQRVDATVSILHQVQVEQRSELVDVVTRLAKEEAAAEKGAAAAAKADAASGTAAAADKPDLMSAQAASKRNAAAALKQLGGVHADGETANMNVSAVALAAVDIAATALDSALLSVERTVERSQQRPEVAQRAGEIAKELGLMTKADQAQSDTSQTNTTGGTWMNLNLFSRNGSDASNSSWLSSDEPDDQQAAAALQKYQQLGIQETDEAELAAGPTLSLLPNHAVDQTHTRLHSHEHNVTEPERTRTQSRAERAGTGL
ncbi:MAG: hypothetical protein FRX49_09857 [Trebouxia sp. A1-2]|nr:MAG: hypothetical protein FRX49_09857 [Trebouxia sp. A1-2]